MFGDVVNTNKIEIVTSKWNDILDKQFAKCNQMNVYGCSLKGSGV